MIEQENAQVEQPEIDEVEVQIEDQVVEAVGSDEELQDYSKSVSKRITKKTNKSEQQKTKLQG